MGHATGTSLTDPAVRWLGRVAYADGLRLQEELLARHMAGENADTLLLLEHDSVFTIGRTPDRTSLGVAESLPAPVVEIGRGGKATWHGPGQLVGYPILNLARYGQDLRHYLRALEQALIDGSGALGVPAGRKEGLTGVWVENRKLASIGVGARHWISQHGFAINICGALEGFDAITPCGIDGVVMTSLEREGVAGISVEKAAQHFAPFVLAGLERLRSSRFLTDAAVTVAAGEALAGELKSGGVVALTGGLGAGKTHLTKGIVRGLGSSEEVTSPTFTLVHEYHGGRLPVFHFDFYRLENESDAMTTGWDEYLDAGGVCVVEWADRFPALIPPDAQWWALEQEGTGRRLSRRK